MHQLMDYAPNKGWIDSKMRQKAKWEPDHPVEADDGNLTKMAAREAAKKAIPNNGDDVTNVNSDLPFISQKASSNTCN
jgi:hypothetical protein